jgi:hypothetical protein
LVLTKESSAAGGLIEASGRYCPAAPDKMKTNYSVALNSGERGAMSALCSYPIPSEVIHSNSNFSTGPLDAEDQDAAKPNSKRLLPQIITNNHGAYNGTTRNY